MLLGLIGVVIFIVSFVATTGITVWFVVKLPADYFVQNGQRRSQNRASISDWVSIPVAQPAGSRLGWSRHYPVSSGDSGQGVLTILLGIMLSDFPGKERLERKIVSYPKVLEALNRLRERFGSQPPLQT